jgi:hypothetical protein
MKMVELGEIRIQPTQHITDQLRSARQIRQHSMALIGGICCTFPTAQHGTTQLQRSSVPSTYFCCASVVGTAPIFCGAARLS